MDDVSAEQGKAIEQLGSKPDIRLGPRRGKMTPAGEIENRFTYHKPFGTQATRYEQIRVAARLLAIQIQIMCPDSREKSTAHTKLQEAIMWANASIAINEEEPTTPQPQTEASTSTL